MKISQEDMILVHEGCCMNFLTSVGNLEASKVC